MTTITLELPEDVLTGVRRSPADFARDLRLAAAMFWYAKAEISQEKAAQIAGLDRADFLLALSRENIEIFQVDAALTPEGPSHG